MVHAGPVGADPTLLSILVEADWQRLVLRQRP